MIRINLATSKIGPLSSISSSMGLAGDGYTAPDEARKEALKRILIICLGPLAFYLYEMQNIPTKRAELASKNQVLQELVNYNSKQAASVAEIKKFKEDEALIETRITALEKISKDRHREIRVMDLVQQLIPEKAWLTRLQINPDKVTIQGFALSDFEVSTFLESLTKSVFLMDVNLVSSSEAIIDGMNLKKFEISCVLERPE